MGALATTAFAADTVTQSVTAGTRTASVADLGLGAVAYSHTAQTPTGSMTLTVDDSTGSNAGWDVTIQTSAFVYSGANGGANIPAANFSLTSAAALTATAGQAVDAVNGPAVPSATTNPVGGSPVGTLDSARKTVAANLAYGNGTYTQGLDVSLLIPAQSAAGTYTGTLTTTVTAAP
jgi:hypothetical protein